MITVAAFFGLTAIFLNCWDSNISQIVLEDVTPKHHKRRGAKDVYYSSYFTLKESHPFVNPFIAQADRVHQMLKRTFLDWGYI
jgi:hypothetical protein